MIQEESFRNMSPAIIPSELLSLQKQLEQQHSPLTINVLESLCHRFQLTAHLAILRQPYLDKVLRGEKIIESRFSKSKLPPFNKVQANDVLFLKESAGLILAMAIVSQVKYYGPLMPGQAIEVMEKYSKGLALEESFKLHKQDSTYGTLIYLDKVISVEPIALNKSDRRAWITFTYDLQPRLF